MIKTIQLYKTPNALRLSLFVLVSLLLAFAFVFCCYYIISGYNDLVGWYRRLGSCFYKNDTWSQDFFTPRIKSDGNMYCFIAMLIVCVGLRFSFIWLGKQNKAPQPPLFIRYHISDVALLPGLVIAVMLWAWGNKMALPAADEVFSAQNVAGIHPFQSLSYYMLPNNHLFFNFLNNILFHPFSDKVATGRFISLIAYCSVVVAVFFWFKSIVGSAWLALAPAIAVSLQFFVWGFSFQARGYEVYLLAEWGMFISLYCHINSGSSRWLYLNMLCCVTGYCCIPSFLYFHAAQLIFMALYQVIYKRKDTLFWKFQLAAILLTYLCYLPALCFSGPDSIISNSYVIAMGAFRNTGRLPFIQWVFPYFQTYINHIFSNLHWRNIPLTLILLLIPAALVLAKKNKAGVLFGMFYIVMWATFFMVAIFMKKMPFERILSGHYSITLAGVLLVGYRLATLVAGKKAWILFSGFSLFFIAYFFSTNERLLKDTLYEYDVNTTYRNRTNWLGCISPGSAVVCSDAEFLSYYICQKKGCTVRKCPNGNEQYYVKQGFEEIPQPYAGKYLLIKKYFGDEIYRLK